MARSLEQEMFMSNRLLPTFTVVMGEEGEAKELLDALWWSLERQIWNHIEDIWKDEMNSFSAEFTEVTMPTPTTPRLRLHLVSMRHRSEFEIKWDALQLTLSSTAVLPVRPHESNVYESFLALLGRRREVLYHTEDEPFSLEFEGTLRTFTGRYGHEPSNPPSVDSKVRLQFETRFSFHPWVVPPRDEMALMGRGRRLRLQPVVRMLHPLQPSPKEPYLPPLRSQLTLKITGYEENMCILQTCLVHPWPLDHDSTTPLANEKEALVDFQSEDLHIYMKFGSVRHLQKVRISLWDSTWLTQEWLWPNTPWSFYELFCRAEAKGCFSMLPLEGLMFLNHTRIPVELYIEIWSPLTHRRRL